MTKKRSITSIDLPESERQKLQEMGRERMRSQGHLIRMALAFWWANGAPETPSDFDFSRAARTKKP